MIRETSQINKSNNMPNGVSRFIELDKRLKKPNPVVCFGVLVAIDGVFTVRKFRVSKEVSEKMTMQTAINFRKYYEQCVENGMKFDFHRYDDWKNGRFAF